MIAVTEVMFFYQEQIQTKAELNDIGKRKKKWKPTEHLKKIKSCIYGSRLFTFPLFPAHASKQIE